MAFVIIDDPVGGPSTTVRTGFTNKALGPYSVVLGGYGNPSLS